MKKKPELIPAAAKPASLPGHGREQSEGLKMSTFNRISKRVFDIVLAVLWLAVGSPIIAAIAFLLWIQSPGNIFFSQKRLGLGGKIFRLYKFRKFPAIWKDEGPGVTAVDDTRMTRFGALLQKTKLDELPQLWNILKGEMSFVGPRPESARFADLFAGKYAEVLSFVPGIFGPNQVKFRNEADLFPADEAPEMYYRRELFPRKAENDLEYFRTANLISDIAWILRGFWVSIVGTINWQRFVHAHAKILLTDAALICFGWFLSNIIRFSGIPSRSNLNLQGMLTGLWLIPPVVIAGMLVGGCYRHPARYFSFDDGVRLISVVPSAFLCAFLLLLGIVHRGLSFYLVPESSLIIVSLLAVPRIINRMRWERVDGNGSKKCDNILVYGAGRSGAALANWMKTTSNGLTCIGFLDDDSNLRGKFISGYKVLGRESDVPTIHAVHKIHEIWMTFRPNRIKRYRFQKLCEELGIRFVILSELEPFSRFWHEDDKGSSVPRT